MIEHRRLTVRLEHGYFPDGRGAGAHIEPRADTATLLRRHRIGVRRRAAGLELIVAAGEQGAPIAPLPVAKRLQFLICADDPAFVLYTDLAGMSPGSLLHFRAVVRDDGTSEPRRAISALRRATDPPAALALLTVPGSWLSAGGGRGAGAPEPLVLRLPASAAYWRYYCSLPQSVDAETVTIVQRRSDTDPRRIEFATSGRMDFGDAADTDDPIARALGARQPGRRVIALTSSDTVPARAAGRPHLSLMLGEQAVVEQLPSPPLSSLLAARSPSEVVQRGTAIAFRTVDILSHPSHDLGA